MTQEIPSGMLMNLSTELASVVEKAAASVVRVDDGTRLTASGIIWSADGLIAATSHGVERDEDLSIVLADETRLPATLIGRDPDTDIALLKVEGEDLTAFAPAPADEVKVGHLAVAVARPGAFGLQATLGLVNARLETQSKGQPEYILHTDAVFYPGFSGGALINLRGELLGMLNLVFGRGRGVAVGTPTLAHVIETLQKHGRVQKGYLGVRTQRVPLPEHLVQSLGLPQQRGLLLVQVESGGPAEKGGLLPGDILLQVSGQALDDVDTLRHLLRHRYAGESLALDLLRGGERRTLDVTLGAE